MGKYLSNSGSVSLLILPNYTKWPNLSTLLSQKGPNYSLKRLLFS